MDDELLALFGIDPALFPADATRVGRGKKAKFRAPLPPNISIGAAQPGALPQPRGHAEELNPLHQSVPHVLNEVDRAIDPVRAGYEFKNILHGALASKNPDSILLATVLGLANLVPGGEGRAGAKIVSAATKVGDRVFTAPIHAMAEGAAREAGATGQAIHGFVTSEGAFVTKREAQQIARKAEQLKFGDKAEVASSENFPIGVLQQDVGEVTPDVVARMQPDALRRTAMFQKLKEQHPEWGVREIAAEIKRVEGQPAFKVEMTDRPEAIQREREIIPDSVAARGAKSIVAPRDFGGRLTTEEVARERAGTVLQVKKGQITEVPRKVSSARALLPFAEKDFAAVRVPDGRVFRGADHAAAVEAAKKAGVPDWGGWNDMTGFALKDGTFVTRAEGTRLFEKARKQVGGQAITVPKEAHASDIKRAMGDSVAARGLGALAPNSAPLTLSKKVLKEVLRGVEPEVQGDVARIEGRAPTMDEKWAVMTPENPQGRQVNPKLNATLLALHKAETDARGIPYTLGRGGYIDDKTGQPLTENSFFLHGVDESVAADMGRRRQQNSVVVPSGLLDLHSNTLAPSTGITEGAPFAWTDIPGLDKKAQPPGGGFESRQPFVTFRHDIDFSDEARDAVKHGLPMYKVREKDAALHLPGTWPDQRIVIHPSSKVPGEMQATLLDATNPTIPVADFRNKPKGEFEKFFDGLGVPRVGGPRPYRAPAVVTPPNSGNVLDESTLGVHVPEGVSLDRPPVRATKEGTDLSMLDDVLKRFHSVYTPNALRALRETPQAAGWYDTSKLRDAMSSLSPEGQKDFDLLMRLMGPTSAGTDVPNNVRQASWFFQQYKKDPEGLLAALRSNKVDIPEGYKSRLGQTNVNRGVLAVLEGKEPNWSTAPKVSRYAAALGLHNWGGAALDVHVGRQIGEEGMLMKSGAHERAAGVGYPEPSFPQTDFVSSSPADSHYPALERALIRQANKFGLAPTQYQALGWRGGAAQTGVKDSRTMLEILNSKFRTTADRYNFPTPLDAFKAFAGGKTPLWGVLGAAGLGGGLLYNDGSQPPR